MLSNPARFALGYFGFANGIEEGGLAVIYMTHDGHHWRAALQIIEVIHIQHFRHFACRRLFSNLLHFIAQFLSYLLGGGNF